jgi:hypothetical protein
MGENQFPATSQRVPLTGEQLEQCLGRARLDALSLARFGAVMMSEAVYSGSLTMDLMFREKPEPGSPFSGWVFFSSKEPPEASSEKRGIKFHDCLAILRIAPEVAAYLDMPAGTRLVRTGEQTFELDEEFPPPTLQHHHNGS